MTHGTGDVVALEDACFTPSIISVTPGTEITFVNQDPFAHNVGGNGWGHYDDLWRDDRFPATFDQEGVHPFACSLHPGMTGAVIVGDGEGPANGKTILPAVDPDGPSDASPAAAVVDSGAGTSSSTDVGALLIAVLVGVAVGIGLTFLRRRATRAVAA